MIRLTRKPYPWRCSKCREDAVYAGSIDYKVNLEFEGRKYQIKLDGLKTPKCRKCGTPCLDDQANTRITLEFLRQAKLLTPHQIKRHRQRRGFTRADLAKEVGVDESAIARWEEGLQFQTRSEDELLRDILTARKLRLSKKRKLALVLRCNVLSRGQERAVNARIYLHPLANVYNVDEALDYLEAGNIDPVTSRSSPVKICVPRPKDESDKFLLVNSAVFSGKKAASLIREHANYPKPHRTASLRRKKISRPLEPLLA